MSPCCLAAATATAVLTALTVIGLTAFVLVTDGFGLGLMVATLLALALQRLGRIGPCPTLLHALSALLALRAAWLLATSRRALVVGVYRFARARVSSVQHLTHRRRAHQAGCAAGPHASCRAESRSE